MWLLFPQYWLTLMYRHLASNRITGTLPVFGQLVSLEQLYALLIVCLRVETHHLLVSAANCTTYH
jgi:hypothetical protein